MNDIKIERNQSTILRELNLILQREFPDTDFLKALTVHEVKLSNDMSHAKVFYSFMDISADKEAVENEIQAYLKEIRRILAGKIEMKSVPELTFEYDETLDNANKIEEILEKIK